jgi:deoxyribodipyrimidine photo-lyase
MQPREHAADFPGSDHGDKQSPLIVWFRDDLRLSDNPALHAAAQLGRPLVCIFVHDEETEGLRPLGGAARWWLHGCLQELGTGLGSRGGRLLIFKGQASKIIPRLARSCKAAGVVWNRRYGAAERLTDEAIKTELKTHNIGAQSFNGHLLYEPWSLKSKSGGPFRVFSAFWRAAHASGEPGRPLAEPSRLEFFDRADEIDRHSIALADLALEPSSPDWAGGLRARWQRGEAGAQARLKLFLENDITRYADSRDYPDRPATSKLSPYLRFGNISARQVWHAAVASTNAEQAGNTTRNLDKFLSELGWREFSNHLLFHNPDIASRNLQPKFDTMRWNDNATELRAWQQGKTGYPIVDAGMRELWTTGWMHNRVRMVVASFLVKHLLFDWRQGEAWFWDTLVDADMANNAASWQWVAGSGADAAPYYRVFNPVLQGEKFDPEGNYVRRWVPELSDVPTSVVHRPWQSETGYSALKPAHAHASSYAKRLIDHDYARKRALESYKALA